MLSIYGKSIRPQQAIDAIVAATVEYPERTFKKWQKLNNSDPNYIHVIVSGEVEIRRISDGLSMFVLRNQGCLGLSAAYNPATHPNTYGLARSPMVIRTLTKADFERLMSEKGLWPEVMQILAWHINLLSKRDDILVARSAYSVVREFLLEINDLIIQHKREVNVYDYIQEYTNLARSTIIKILSDLKKGHYIVVEKGKLITINSLPERY